MYVKTEQLIELKVKRSTYKSSDLIHVSRHWNIFTVPYMHYAHPIHKSCSKYSFRIYNSRLVKV